MSLTIRRRGEEEDLSIYASDPYDDVIGNYQKYRGKYTLFSNEQIQYLIPGKISSRDAGYRMTKSSSNTKQPVSVSSSNENSFLSLPKFLPVPLTVQPQGKFVGMPGMPMNMGMNMGMGMIPKMQNYHLVPISIGHGHGLGQQQQVPYSMLCQALMSEVPPEISKPAALPKTCTALLSERDPSESMADSEDIDASVAVSGNDAKRSLDTINKEDQALELQHAIFEEPPTKKMKTAINDGIKIEWADSRED